MKQGVLCNHRVRLLFKKGMSCYRERRKGMRKRKSVRGCSAIWLPRLVKFVHILGLKNGGQGVLIALPVGRSGKSEV